jgi:hypothetical protein
MTIFGTSSHHHYSYPTMRLTPSIPQLSSLASTIDSIHLLYAAYLCPSFVWILYSPKSTSYATYLSLRHNLKLVSSTISTVWPPDEREQRGHPQHTQGMQIDSTITTPPFNPNQNSK